VVGYGESDSDNRAHEALTQALKNPLMDRGRMLADAIHVLVQVAGGPGMTLSEVEILMQELGRHVSDQTQILFGTVVDARLGDRLSVTIISSLSAEEDASLLRRLPRRTVRPQCRQFNDTKRQHRNLKFKLKNRLSRLQSRGNDSVREPVATEAAPVATPPPPNRR
jgi:cell division GTPase FtsZ